MRQKVFHTFYCAWKTFFQLQCEKKANYQAVYHVLPDRHKNKNAFLPLFNCKFIAVRKLSNTKKAKQVLCELRTCAVSKIKFDNSAAVEHNFRWLWVTQVLIAKNMQRVCLNANICAILESQKELL